MKQQNYAALVVHTGYCPLEYNSINTFHLPRSCTIEVAVWMRLPPFLIDTQHIPDTMQ